LWQLACAAPGAESVRARRACPFARPDPAAGSTAQQVQSGQPLRSIMAPKKEEKPKERPILGRFKSNLKMGIVSAQLG
jgi:hypothetical protein